MIIDFHTHVFPVKIASRTIEFLSKKGHIEPFSDGTVSGLLDRMTIAGVDISVTLPVLTSPDQFESVLRYAKSINSADYKDGPRLISFAGIHPRCDDIEGKMRRIKDEGFLGVKIHPDYQGTYVDDDAYVKILRLCAKLDLILVTHSGVDMGFWPEIRCTPKRVLNLMEKAPGAKLVLAHMGANMMEDDVLYTLAGKDVYFDTAYVLPHLNEGWFKGIYNKHGKDKILFASDSPWSDIFEDIEIIRSYSLGTENEEKIFYKNAERLLNL